MMIHFYEIGKFCKASATERVVLRKLERHLAHLVQRMSRLFANHARIVLQNLICVSTQIVHVWVVEVGDAAVATEETVIDCGKMASEDQVLMLLSVLDAYVDFEARGAVEFLEHSIDVGGTVVEQAFESETEVVHRIGWLAGADGLIANLNEVERGAPRRLTRSPEESNLAGRLVLKLKSVDLSLRRHGLTAHRRILSSVASSARRPTKKHLHALQAVHERCFELLMARFHDGRTQVSI